MWTSSNETLAQGRIIKHRIYRSGQAVAYSEVLNLWQTDETFRKFFTGFIADCPFAAFRWETPPIAVDTQQRPFEFVVVDSPGLASRPDRQAFAEHFDPAGTDSIVAFRNLGGDARLIAPCPLEPDAAYGHIGTFHRKAPADQQHALWQRVGAEMERAIAMKSIWLSTAGAGVSWLHVRIDQAPKYYAYAPYRSQEAFSSDWDSGNVGSG